MLVQQQLSVQLRTVCCSSYAQGYRRPFECTGVIVFIKHTAGQAALSIVHDSGLRRRGVGLNRRTSVFFLVFVTTLGPSIVPLMPAMLADFVYE